MIYEDDLHKIDVVISRGGYCPMITDSDGDMFTVVPPSPDQVTATMHAASIAQMAILLRSTLIPALDGRLSYSGCSVDSEMFARMIGDET